MIASSKSEESVAPSRPLATSPGAAGIEASEGEQGCLSVNDFASLKECARAHYRSTTDYNALLIPQLPFGL